MFICWFNSKFWIWESGWTSVEICFKISLIDEVSEIDLKDCKEILFWIVNKSYWIVWIFWYVDSDCELIDKLELCELLRSWKQFFKWIWIFEISVENIDIWSEIEEIVVSFGIKRFEVDCKDL
jgi:hypothetical protein